MLSPTFRKFRENSYDQIDTDSDWENKRRVKKLQKIKFISLPNSKD